MFLWFTDFWSLYTFYVAFLYNKNSTLFYLCTEILNTGLNIFSTQDLIIQCGSKINLTLFKTHVSHKWKSIMNLFDNIYKAYLGYNVVKSGIKIDAQILKQGPFFDKQSRKILHTRKTNGVVPIDQCTNPAHALIFWYIDWAVHDDTKVQYNTSNKAP